MRRPAVLIVAIPHVCASALAFCLRRAERYEVYAPDVAAGERVPRRRFDAVVTTVPVPEAAGDVVIELPQSFDRPVAVSVRDLRFAVSVSEAHPIEDVAGLLHGYFFQGGQPVQTEAAATLSGREGSTGPIRASWSAATPADLAEHSHD